MDSTGAAIKDGVNPETGEYLSKAQRIAMFRASRGGFGGGGGGGTSSGGKVNPTNAIVAVNRLSTALQTVQKNYQSTANTVAEQVTQNRSSINNIATNIAETREQETKNIIADTRAAQRARENYLRGAAESLREGIGKAAGAAISGAGRAAKAAIQPARGLLQRILGALGYLLGAWALDNLPELQKRLKNFFKKLPQFPKLALNFLTNFRGFGSILDIIFRRAFSTLNAIARGATRSIRWIIRKSGELIGKIFTPIKNFLSNLVSKLISKLKNVYGGLVQSFKNLLPNGGGKAPIPKTSGSPDTPKLDKPKSTKPKGFFGRLKQVGSNITGAVKKTFDKGLGGLKKATSNIGQSFKNITGIGKGGGDLAKQTKFIEDTLEPLKEVPALKTAGIGSKIAGFAKGILRRIPFFGFAIDLMLNRGVGKLGWAQSIIRALFSSGAGAIGAAGGAKIGAGIGGGIGLAAGGIGAIPGAAIGAGLGSIIGSILLGYLGDQAGKLTYEQFAGLDSSAVNKDVDLSEKAGVAAGAGAELGISELDGDSNLIGPSEASKTFDYTISGASKNTTEGLSTPDGLGKPGTAKDEVNFVNLGDSIEELPMQNSSSESYGDESEAPQEFPKISSNNPATDFYKTISMKYYELAGV